MLARRYNASDVGNAQAYGCEHACVVADLYITSAGAASGEACYEVKLTFRWTKTKMAHTDDDEDEVEEDDDDTCRR